MILSSCLFCFPIWTSLRHSRSRFMDS